MAFDMYIDNEREFIDHHEEEIFSLINEDDSYPMLNWLWQEYYDGPKVEPRISNDLVHELIALRSSLTKDQKYLLVTIDRLLPFLSKAFVLNKTIRCVSD